MRLFTGARELLGSIRMNMRAAAAAAFLGVFFLLGAVAAQAQLGTVTYVSGLSSPTAFVQDPSDPTVQYVTEQRGVIRVIKNGVVQGTPFLNITSLVQCCGEQGLLGLAFPPNYGTSGRFFVNYTRAGDGRIVVARYRRSGNSLRRRHAGFFAGLVEGEDSIRHPFSNHNAGCMNFGSDGYLYISQGDGGSGGDPEGNAQNPNALLGKFLRIDINVPDSHPQGFVVPAGNAGLGRPEIWSLGWRNPWRFSFDSPALGGTGAMLVADVGRMPTRKSTTSLRVAADGTTAGKSARAPIRIRMAAARRSRSSIRFTTTTTARAGRSPEVTSTAGPPSRRCGDATSSQTT